MKRRRRAAPQPRAATVAAVNRERLAKLLGMLGSAHDDEVIAAARAAESLDELTRWEKRFVSSVRDQRYPLTRRQREVLDRIVWKVRAARAA